MKESFLSLLKLSAGIATIFLSGCATPFINQNDHLPSPEDTLIKCEPVAQDYIPHERALSVPRRPEPEPEEVLIEEEVSEPEVTGAEYTVQKGDCLFWIAKKFHITLRDLLEANGLDKDSRLSIGQKLILPGIDQSQVDHLAAQFLVYVIQKGDCLSTIAHRYGVSVQEIKVANGLKSDRIIAGKKLTIPEKGRYSGVKESSESPVKIVEAFEVDDDGYYVLRRGDSLSKIADKAKVTVRDLQEWNDIEDPAKIQAGQKILVRDTIKSSVREIVHPLPVEDTPVQNSVADPYGFMNDADFFSSIDDIPVVQVQN